MLFRVKWYSGSAVRLKRVLFHVTQLGVIYLYTYRYYLINVQCKCLVGDFGGFGPHTWYDNL